MEKKEFTDTQSEPTLDGRDEILGEGRNHDISSRGNIPRRKLKHWSYTIRSRVSISC